MPFCDIGLARRIEAAERRLVESAVAAVRRRLPDTLALPIAGGFAAWTEPGSPLNKVVGLGFAPLDASAWVAIEQEHARRGAPVQVELGTLADPAIARWLTGRGYELVGTENVLGRALDAAPAPAPPSDARIDTVPTAGLDAWIDAMATGFTTPDAQGVPSHESFDRAVVERVVRDFAAADGVVLFTASCGGEVAGTAALRLDGGIAQLCGAATLPAQRRRGVQSALLAHRLAFAAARGCDLCTVTTQPGSKSQQNVMRHGFALLYTRNVLVRPVAGAGGSP